MNDLFQSTPVCGCESCRDVPLPTYTRKFMAQKEAEEVARMDSNADRSRYLGLVEDKRGINAATRLREAVWKVMRA